MKNPIVIIIRFLIFLPLAILLFWLIEVGFAYLIAFAIDIKIIWFILLSMFLGSFFWYAFEMLSGVLTHLVARVSPKKWLGAGVLAILSIINGILLIKSIWTMDIEYSGKIIFYAIVFTFLCLELTGALIYGAVSVYDED